MCCDTMVTSGSYFCKKHGADVTLSAPETRWADAHSVHRPPQNTVLKIQLRFHQSCRAPHEALLPEVMLWLSLVGMEDKISLAQVLYIPPLASLRG